jgi:hypothetical protein
MRTSVVKVILFFLSFISLGIMSQTISEYEKICASIGFKKGTAAYGDCVLELDLRNKSKKNESINKSTVNVIETVKTNQLGDGTPEHQACVGFGFNVGSSQYADCRLQIDIAKRNNEVNLRRYQDEQRVYESQLKEYNRKKEQEKSEAMLKFGLALMGGTSPYASQNFANAGRQSLGMPPTAPERPQNQTFTIVNNKGKIANCNIYGNVINCY